MNEVYPGEKLITKGWKDKNQFEKGYIIQVSTEDGKVVLGNAYAILD
jgi:hypothetical protein